MTPVPRATAEPPLKCVDTLLLATYNSVYSHWHLRLLSVFRAEGERIST